MFLSYVNKKQSQIELVLFLVLGLEEPYDNSWEVEVDGKSFILKNQEEIKYALKELKN